MATFYMPIRIITGDGCFSSLGKEAAALGKRALIVCGASARASGSLDQAREMLAAAGVSAAVFAEVAGEPTLATVAAAIAACREGGAEVVIGLGGGSAMDVAKATAALGPLSGGVREYFAGRALDGPSLPWIAIPTTSGTGAEATMNAVLIDEETCSKQSIRGEGLFARVAIVDPLLTLSLPAKMTAYSGADALCQALEAFVSIAAMPITDGLCREAIRLIGRSLLAAYRDGQDIAARRDMHYASLMAGMALANARLGAVHGMAHPLGCRYRLPHGLICGLLLPYVMEWNLPAAASRYAEAAALLGVAVQGMKAEEAAGAAIEQVQRLFNELGLPKRLSQAGVKEIAFEAVARESMSSSLKHNPRPTSEADVVELLRRAL